MDTSLKAYIVPGGHPSCPTIKANDPVAVKLGARPGDVIKFIYPDETYYRVVVPTRSQKRKA